MGFVETDWGPLLGFYVVVAGISLTLRFTLKWLMFPWLGANLIFLGFVVWFERPFIPVIKKRVYLGILVSVLIIFAGLAVSVIPCLK